MDDKIRNWVNTVAKTNRGLAPLLRGIVAIQKDSQSLTIIWASDFHRDKGRQATDRIRGHLGAMRDWKIEHVSVPEMARADTMLDEALKLGGRLEAVYGEE